MKVEIKINPDIAEITAVIHAPKMTPELIALVESLEGVEDKASLLTAKKDGKIFIIEPSQIDIIRVEGGELKLYNQNAQEFVVAKSLQEILDSIGNNFVRISKSAIVNVNRVDHLSNSFNGTMYIVMKNGVSDYISRKYLADFKKRFVM